MNFKSLQKIFFLQAFVFINLEENEVLRKILKTKAKQTCLRRLLKFICYFGATRMGVSQSESLRTHYFKKPSKLVCEVCLLLETWTVRKTLTSSSLERRWSSRTFRYGYLVTTSPQLSDLPSTAPSLKVGSLASGISDSHGVTGGVYKTRERIHRGILIRDY